ncbi:hypothetical protein CY34DRAFT_808129 [Suillus luteus UH-Slu-Lm8-n1]|uniref:Uncharacterized protein n=1 Tax=Suillus luteus UH-Slu-Lm8-n1 TaxID=930992 RepID=A0A0C9ZPL3_9AGAM|nr:hypothetical protein CY34DRAFT_808129 [Suillus luteus UH-Slu-Lm8-n1]
MARTKITTVVWMDYDSCTTAVALLYQHIEIPFVQPLYTSTCIISSVCIRLGQRRSEVCSYILTNFLACDSSQ